MKRLKEGIDELLREGDSSLAKARRVAQIHARFEEAVAQVYDANAPFVLDHVNGVYLVDSHITLYVDDSMVRSDLDMRQEFVRMALAERGEVVEGRFKILASSFGMKERHPFRKREVVELDPKAAIQKKPRSGIVTEEQADSLVSGIEDPRVKEALRKAILADSAF